MYSSQFANYYLVAENEISILTRASDGEKVHDRRGVSVGDY
jgi:hypothetical protein